MNEIFRLYLNEKVARHISTMGKAERQRLHEKLDYLAGGIWEGGIQVKKLSGQSKKVVFEGRLSKGDRILFTLGQDNGTTGIYIWALSKHDNVERESRRICPSNVPFLDFALLGQEEKKELYLDEIPQEWYTQESIEEKVESDYGPQKWHILEDMDWQRLEKLAHGNEIDYQLLLSQEQYSVLEKEAPVLLSGTAGSGKTTISVYYLLKKEYLGKRRLFITYSPYLRDFAQRLYHALIHRGPLEDSTPHPEFLTIEELEHRFLPPDSPLNDPAKEVGFAEFQRIIASHPQARKYNAELVWEEIRSIIKGAKPSIPSKRLERLHGELETGRMSIRDRQELASLLSSLERLSFFHSLEKLVRAKTDYTDVQTFAAALGNAPQRGETDVVSALRELVQKKREQLAEPLLTLHEYVQLGAKRAPHFVYDRELIYSIAQFYQKKLQESGLYDEIDLGRWALIERRHAQKTNQEVPSWDLVVCDEIQDMTDLQVELLFSVAVDRNRVFFAGDDRQIINPSGFRWEEVNKRFYEVGIPVPELLRLRMNFRSTGSIVRLANVLLDLKRQVVGVKKSESYEEWKFAGAPPVLIDGLEEERILHVLRMTGADRIILVRSREDREYLKKTLATELVFTIHDAKGLEFETVLLWKFLGSGESEELWSSLAAREELSEDRIPHLRYEINLLYVAVTRSRSILAIYDGVKPSPVWQTAPLSSVVVRAKDETFLEESWKKASTAEEWKQQGTYFFERRYYRAAAECFKNAGEEAKEETALAWAAHEEGDYATSASLFEKQKNHALAAQDWEALGNFKKALENYSLCKDKKALTRLRILSLEQEKRWVEAGDLRYKAKEVDLAIKDWEAGFAYDRLGEIFYKKKNYPKAGRYYERAGKLSEAIRAYTKDKNYSRAAELLLSKGETEEALALIRKRGTPSAYMALCKRTGDPKLIGLAFLDSQTPEEAFRYLADYGNRSPEARDELVETARGFETKRRPLKAAIVYSSLGLHQEAALCYQKAYLFEEAAHEYYRAGNFIVAGREYFKSESYYKAISAWDQVKPEDLKGKLEKVDAISSSYSKLLRRGAKKRDEYDQALANAMFSEAAEYVKKGEYLNALARFRLFGETEPLMDCLAKLGDDDLALDEIVGRNNYALWEIYRKRRPRISLDFKASINRLRYEAPLFKSNKKRSDKDSSDTNSKRAQLRGGVALLKDIFMDVPDESALEASLDCRTFTVNLVSQVFDDKKALLELGEDLIPVLSKMGFFGFIENLFLPYRNKLKPDRSIAPFMQELILRARDSEDYALVLCLTAVQGLKPDTALLERIPVTTSTWKLLAPYEETYEAVLVYLIDIERIDDAVKVLKQHKQHLRAAELLLSKGSYKRAGKILEEARAWDRALAVYTDKGDQKSVDRLLKKMAKAGINQPELPF